MTGLTIPYNADKHPYAGLTNWSTEFPFEVQGVKYPSVDHYIFCKMTRHNVDATLLSMRNDIILREKFNDISDRLYQDATKQILEEGVHLQFVQNKFFRTFFLEKPDFYFYYISDDVLWGINDNGYGFNLLGQAYARLTNPRHSSTYPMTKNVIYMIYTANSLLIHHLQQGNDVLSFIGKPIDGIVSALRNEHPDIAFLDSDTVYKNYLENPYFQNIQYEIDYPWNLAGFVRKQYARQINFYLRSRFNRLMISKYFAHVLKKRYSTEIDSSQMNYYVNKQIELLTEQKFQDMADMLYRMYNDPSTTEKTFVFLEQNDIQMLYEIEIQFLSSEEMNRAIRYVPFLYQIKHGKSMYIYDNVSVSNIEPYTTSLSPMMTYEFQIASYEYATLVKYFYVKLTQSTVSIGLEKSYNLYRSCDAISEYQEKYQNAIQSYKMILMRRGMNTKFSSNLFSRYLLYNSNEFSFDIRIEDPDPTFQHHISNILIDIRNKITEPYFPVSYALLGNNIYLQDHIRYRMEDFLHVFDAYRIYRNNERIDETDVANLQKYIYRDPTMGKKSRPVHPQFYEYFASTCSMEAIEDVWQTFLVYASLLTSNDMSRTEERERENRRDMESICAIVAYFVKTFYRGTDNMRFYDFVVSVLIGKSFAFTPSLTYYSTDMEKCLQNVMEVDNYEADFVVNIMGIVQTIDKRITIARHRYYSFWAVPIHSPPYPSNLGSRVSATAIIGRIEDEERKEKRRGRRKKAQIEEDMLEEVPVQQELEQEEMDVAEMLRDLGLEDEEEEVENEQYDSDMETHYGDDFS